MNAAAQVGLQPEQVIIHTLAAGGTFGRRANPESDYIAEVASIAKATGGKYPVRSSGHARMTSPAASTAR